jgi:membrane-bound ClpP family serine protease
MYSLSIYLLGVLIVTAGLAMLLHLAGVPTAWIGAGGVVVLGIGVLTAVSKTRTRDQSPM